MTAAAASRPTPSAAPSAPSELSVVLIARNEAPNIRRAVQAVLAATQESAAEVVVVDSASDDGTAEIASELPVTVLQLLPDQPLSPAAGRYVGGRWTSGRLVLFLDGDMELLPCWLEEARDVFAAHPDIAVITGPLVEAPTAAGGSNGPPRVALRPVVPALSDVAFAAGAGLYRRRVLQQVGSFQPFLRSDEEPELCLRIRLAGHRVVSTSRPMARHHSPPDAALGMVLARWRRGLFVGSRQNLRLLRGTPAFWPYARERGFAVAPALVAVSGSVYAVMRVQGRRRPLGAWLSAVSVTLAADVLRRGGDVRGCSRSLLQRMLIVHVTLTGLRQPPPPADAYPGRVRVVRRHP